MKNRTSLLDRISYRILSSFSEEKLRIMMAVKEGGHYARKIEQQMSSMRPVEVSQWKSGVIRAKHPVDPNRVQLIDVYNNTLRDLHLAAMIERRVLMVQGSRFRMVGGSGEEVPEATELLEEPWFMEVMQHWVHHLFKGTMVVEVSELTDAGRISKLTLVPQKHVKPEIGHIVKLQGEQKGWPYREGRVADYYLQLGGDKWLGQLENIAPVVIAKKYAVAAWLQYAEMFGVPFRWLTTPAQDEKRLNELEAIMKNMGTAGWAVINESEQVNLMETAKTDAHKVFSELMAKLDSQVAIAVLGNDGTVKNQDNTGTYGSVQTLFEVTEAYHRRDKMNFAHWMNKELLPRLLRFGYPFAGLRFEWDEAYDMDVPEYIDSVVKLSQYYEVSTQQITDKTGIEIIGMKQNNPLPLPPAPPDEGDEGDEGDGGEDPPDPEDGPQQQQQKPVGGKKPLAIAVNELYKGCSHAAPITPVAIDEEAMESAFEEALRAVYEGTAANIALQLYLRHANEYWKGFSRGFGSSLQDISWDTPDYLRLMKLKSSTFRFSAAKNHAQYKELSKLLTEGDKVRSFTDFKAKAKQIYKDYNLDWLNTEYVTAKRQGVMSRIWFEAERDKDLFDLQYETAGDSKVRDEHARMDGIVRPVDDAFWDRWYPPNGWRCRCSVRQVAKSSTFTPSEDLPPGRPPDGFDFNAGKQGEMMVDGHPFKETITNKSFKQRFSRKELEAEQDYGLWGLKRIYSKPERLTRAPKDFDNQQDYFDWWRKTRAGNEVKLVDAVDGLGSSRAKVAIDGELIQKLARRTDKQGARWAYAKRMIPTMTKPDEVWELQSNNRFTLRFVKYYDDQPMIVNVEATDSGLRVKTAYKLNTDDDPTGRFHRVGQLRFSK